MHLRRACRLNVLMTVVATNIIDLAGRKILLMAGTSVMLASLVALGIVLLYMPSGGAQGPLAVVCVVLYVVGFAIGLGGVTFVLIGEVVANKIRSKAYSIFMAVSWVANLILTLSVLSLIDGLGGGACGCALGTVLSRLTQRIPVRRAGSAEAQEKRGVAYVFWIFGGVVIGGLVFVNVCARLLRVRPRLVFY